MSVHYHFEVLPSVQKDILQTLSSQSWLDAFYLVGGTALALHIGHRQSVDFDFFTGSDFKNRDIISYLMKLGQFELFDEAQHTVNGSLNNVKLSFIKYDYPLLKSTHTCSSVQIADIIDIATMKLSAISGRGDKKDFIDMCFLLKQFAFSELFAAYKEKYGEQVSNFYHLQKSLLYFKDAESQPMPRMLETIEWEDIKKTIIHKVKEIGL